MSDNLPAVISSNLPVIYIEKYIVDNKVAVLLSPEYGAGWSTWNKQYPQILFDPKVVAMILAGYDKDENLDNEMTNYLKATYPRGYFGGLRDLEVCWVDVGTKFVVDEYDGYESIRRIEGIDWITA